MIYNVAVLIRLKRRRRIIYCALQYSLIKHVYNEFLFE